MLLVKCIYKLEKDNLLTEGTNYIDLDTDNEMIKIINDNGEIAWYYLNMFEILGIKELRRSFDV
jgi:hypothetical protein